MKKLLKKIGVIAFWLGVWVLLYFLVGRSILLPSPLQTLVALVKLASTASFWLDVSFSLFRVMVGIALGIIIGVTLAVISCTWRWTEQLFSPLLSIIKATPIASFIILALVWLNLGQIPMFTSILVVLPIVASNVSSGIRATSVPLLEMGQAFNLTKKALLKEIYLPSIKPYFAAAANVCIGFAWKAGIAAEVLCTPLNSIGRGLYNAKIYLETDYLFAWTLVVVALSMIIEKLIFKNMKKGYSHV